MLVLIGTAVAGLADATERETRVRARVWCEALVDRDPLRYQETFRRSYFRGRFDRFANLYREATEASIEAQMPETTQCGVDGPPRLSTEEEQEVFIPVKRTGPGGETERLELRMRKEAGFWVIYQLVRPE
ncbi:MAG: hypothetical protein KY429_04775 [Actinobacteria bacterium]|nr:hypothetical protein [Actinomycetota bacterium]